MEEIDELAFVFAIEVGHYDSVSLRVRRIQGDLLGFLGRLERALGLRLLGVGWHVLLLAGNPGKTLHKEYLFNQIWGMDSDSEYQTLTVHIKMLRDKIEEDPRNPRRIQTVWGIGYRYEEI